MPAGRPAPSPDLRPRFPLVAGSVQEAAEYAAQRDFRLSVFQLCAQLLARRTAALLQWLDVLALDRGLPVVPTVVRMLPRSRLARRSAAATARR